MSFFQLGNRAGRRRDKVFGMGRPVPLDRNAKARIMTRARALMRRTQAGKAYGKITAKDYAVIGALLYAFHNAAKGWCYPGYEKIAEAATCAVSTVSAAIKRLEAAGLLTWVNRMKRVREWKVGPLGFAVLEARIVRTSNAYQFNDPQKLAAEPIETVSKSENRAGTTNQDIFSSNRERRKPAAPPPAPVVPPEALDLTGIEIKVAPGPVKISPTLARMLGIQATV